MSPLAHEIISELEIKPRHFSEVVDSHRDVPWPQFLQAWGEIRATNILQRDDDGHYWIQNE